MRALVILAPPVLRRYEQNPDQVFWYASLIIHVRFLSQRPLLMGRYDGWLLSLWLRAALYRLRGPQTCGLSGCSLSKSSPTTCRSVTFLMKRSSPLSSAMDHYPLVQSRVLPRKDSVMRCGIS